MAKSTRHSREELRALILDTGRTMLQEEGLSSGAEALTFKRVFDRIEGDTGIRLTNASVIRRVWESQSDFQTDVLVTVARGQNGTEIDRAQQALGPILASIDLTTCEVSRSRRSETFAGSAANSMRRPCGNQPTGRS